MKEDFRHVSVDEYLKRLGSGAPTPGGGAAAALMSAQGAALVMMVANHTIGKPKYAEFEELNKEILADAEALMDRLADGIDKDAEAFGKVSAAYSMPRESDEEKALRDKAIASASVEAAEAPLSVMEDSLTVLDLAASMKGRSNKNLESDIYVAALSLCAGIRSAYCNVAANLPAIEKADPACASQMRLRAAEIISASSDIMAEQFGER